TLDQRVRVVAQDVAIVAGARLTLIGVADDVLLHGGVARHEAPLDPDGEGGAPAPAQSRGLDRVDDLLARRLGGEDVAPGLVTPKALIDLERPGALVAQRLEAGQVQLVVPVSHWHSLRRSALLQRIEHLIDLLGRQMLVVDMIDHHHGRTGAGGQALFLTLEENASVGGALARTDAEFLLHVGGDVLAAAQHAGNVRADTDVVAAAQVRLEHRVEAGDLVHLYRRQRQVGGNRIHQRHGEKAAIVLLRGAQRRDHRRALPTRRELRDPVIDLAAYLGRELHTPGGTSRLQSFP